MALALAFPSFAQTETELKETVITATRTVQPLTDIVADVSIIDREALERSGATSLSDVLARVPGVEFSRNGGPGTTTGVFVRGGESRFTAVYIDGVRVDSQATGGAAWETIPLALIDRVEILRGPAGAIYGSDALSGVVQIFTRKGEDGFSPFAGVGLGTHQTKKFDAGFSGADGGFDYALGASREISRGFNARPFTAQNPDRDGYQSTSAHARLGLQVNAVHRVEASVLASDLNSQYDGSATSDDRNLHTLQTLGVSWIARWGAHYHTRVSMSESRDRYETQPSPYRTQTRLRGYLWQNEWRLDSGLFTATLERKEDRLENAPIDRSRSQDALALGYGWNRAGHTLQLNLRHDQDSEFGGRGTGSVAYGYALAPTWRVTASAGTAFRAPTLYHRFSVYGVPTLSPESSRNLELGLRHAQGASEFGLVVYRSRITNLISFSSPGACASSVGCYANNARAMYEGLTLSGRHRFAGLLLAGSIDLQDPRDLDTGKKLRRRARRHAMLTATTRLGGWEVGAEAQLSARRFEDAANTQVLAGYGLLNLYAGARIARDWSVLVRVDNLAGRNHQLAQTYATGGRMFYAGLKWAPR